ncbi:MAG: hypothetical protein Q9185_005152 [Variospora sp. 1 TL-2023]
MTFDAIFFSVSRLSSVCGALNPPSSLSSPFCGQSTCFCAIARIINPNTTNQAITRTTVITQPTIWSPRDRNALPTAKVAVIKAVLGKMKENQFIPNANPPSCRAQDQCAPTETKKNHMASPQIHRHTQLAMTFAIIAANGPSPMKSALTSAVTFLESESAMPRMAATVNPLGPTETNIPGLALACGSFCVISR